MQLPEQVIGLAIRNDIGQIWTSRAPGAIHADLFEKVHGKNFEVGFETSCQ
jgi:hypothetical protein